jgi:putative Holliday junction resolvase
MKYLGIDYGTKRVGLAVSDETGSIAFPHSIVPNDEELVPKLTALVKDAWIRTVVIGDTRAEGGAANPVTPEAEQFAEQLKTATEVPVEWVREAGSSIEASRYAPPGREHDDSAAAAILLQRYLDARPASHPDVKVSP